MAEEPEVIEDDEPGRNMVPLLIGLAGLTVIAIVLVAVKATRAPSREPLPAQPFDPEDWQASLQHLAGAIEIRFAGIDTRLDQIVADKLAASAATSVPPEPLVESPPTMNGPMTAHVSDTEVTPPPGPAAVSVEQ